MTYASLPIGGGCLCGKVRFAISAPPILTSACHCRGCQKLSASAFSLSAAFPTDAFAITKGEPVVGALHREEAPYWFCDWCKNWLYTQPPPQLGFVMVRTAMLDDPSGFEPFIEVWTDEKLDWAQTPAKHSFGTEPPFETYAAMIAGFAANKA